jgi:hypothetical protein
VIQPLDNSFKNLTKSQFFAGST